MATDVAGVSASIARALGRVQEWGDLRLVASSITDPTNDKHCSLHLAFRTLAGDTLTLDIAGVFDTCTLNRSCDLVEDQRSEEAAISYRRGAKHIALRLGPEPQRA